MEYYYLLLSFSNCFEKNRKIIIRFITVIKLTFTHFFQDMGLVSNRVRLACWEEGASLVLVDIPSNDGFTINLPQAVEVLLH